MTRLTLEELQKNILIDVRDAIEYAYDTAVEDERRKTEDPLPKYVPHCWHDTGIIYAGNPPRTRERCCWCGEYRDVQICEEESRSEGHGEYMEGDA